LQTFAQTWFVTLPRANNSDRQKNLKRELGWRLLGLVGLLRTLVKYLARKKKEQHGSSFLKKKHGTKLVLPPSLVEKLIWVPFIFLY